MVKKEKVKIVTEDIRMGGENGSYKASSSFGGGYDDFQFPLTVSFYEHGNYTVRIEGKKAIVEKI